MQRIEFPLALLSTVAAGSFLFWGNLHTDDTGIIAGLIFIFTAMTGFVFQKAGLICGSAMGLSILASELWRLRLAGPRPSLSTFKDFVLLFLFVSVVSVIGSLTGFGVRRAFGRNSMEAAPKG